MSEVMYLNIGLAAINLAFGAVLAWVYARNHAELRSPFTAGLALFGVFIVLHNGAIIYHFVTMMSFYISIDELFVTLMTALQTAALASLAVATMR